MIPFSFFVKLASSVAVSKGSKTNPNDLRKYFPDFMWLLRDVTLLPVDEDGKEISATDYLKKRVLVAEEDGFDESTSDKVGRAILTFFPTINCVTLPPPSDKVVVMREIEKNEKQLNPEFNKQINGLIAFLKQNVATKKMFESGKPINGTVMACLTQQFVAEVNDPNNTPALTSTWESTIKLLVSEVQERLVNEYEEDFTKAFQEDMSDRPLEEGDSSGQGQSTPTTIFGIHHTLIIDKNKKLVEEVGRFCTTSTDDSSFTQEQLLSQFKKKIIEVKKETFKDQDGKDIKRDVVIGGVLYTFTQKNKERSYKYCQKVFDDLYKPIKDKVDAPGKSYTFENLRKDLKDMMEQYYRQAIGPAKWKVYDQAQVIIKADETVFKRLAGYREKLLKNDAQIAEASRRNQQMSEDINQLRQQLGNEAAENQANILMIREEHKKMRAEMEEEMKRREEIERRKMEEFKETERERFVERMQDNAQQQASIYQKMMEGFEIQNERQIEAFKQLAIQQQQQPPPPPHNGKSNHYNYNLTFFCLNRIGILCDKLMIFHFTSLCNLVYNYACTSI